MKKFLSLVLALIMTMSLVTISAGAKDFTDADEVNYDEAIDVLSALKVVEGYPDESFKPAKTLTRAEAAKIICNMILGPTTAAALSASVAPFSDVAADNWAAGFITYCAQQGIIAGYGNGAFGPTDTLTGYQFMKMLLTALGYDAKIEGYVGTNYSIPVAKQAANLGLSKGLKETFNGNEPVTREEACLYALNTLKATMVEYDSKIIANVNGAQVTVGTSVAQDVKWGVATLNDGNIKNDGFVQFAEKYFPKLELETGNGIYGRPTNVWKLKKAEIGAFTSIEPTVVYTETTEGDDIYKDLGKVVCDTKEYDWTAFVNGTEEKAKDLEVPEKGGDDYKYTGEGTVTEIYVDDDADTVTVCEINYYLGEVSKVKTDDDGEYINVKTLSEGGKNLADKTFYVEGYEEDDYVVFTVDTDEDGDYVIGEVCEPETVTGVVTRVQYDKKDSNLDGKPIENNTYLKMDGDKHVYADEGHMVYNVEDLTEKKHPTLNDEYMLFMDPNGYVLGFKVTAETVDQYLYVKDSDEELEDWVAKVVLPDATDPKVDLETELNTPAITENDNVVHPQNSTIKVTFDKDDNIKFVDKNQNTKTYTNIDKLIWKYSVDKKGVYELTYVPIFDSVNGNLNADASKQATDDTQWYINDAEIENGEAFVTYKVAKKDNDGKDVKDTEGNIVYENKNGFIVDKNTVFVDVKGEKVYTGYKEVPNVEKAELAYVLDGKVAKVVFILGGEIYDEGNIYFVISKVKDRTSIEYDDKDFWTYEKVFVNGEPVKGGLNVKYNADGTNKVLEEGALYKVLKTIDEDYITKVQKVDKPAKDNVWATGADAFWLIGTGTTPEKYTCDDETVFVVVDKTEDGWKISDGDVEDMIKTDKLGKNPEKNEYSECKVDVLKKDGNYAKVVYIYRTEVGTASTAEPKTQYTVNPWQSSDSGSVCFAIYKWANNVQTPLTVREVRDLDLSAKDFTITINGKEYQGLSIVEYGTNSNTAGYVKVSFGEKSSVLFVGDKFITGGTGNTIDFEASIKGLNVVKDGYSCNIDITQHKA